MTDRDYSDPVRTEAYELGVTVTKERIVTRLHRLRETALTAERQDAYDKAIQMVEGLS